MTKVTFYKFLIDLPTWIVYRPIHVFVANLKLWLWDVADVTETCYVIPSSEFKA